MGDYPLSIPDTSDTYLTIPHMVTTVFAPVSWSAPLTEKKNSPSPLTIPRLSSHFSISSLRSTPNSRSSSGLRPSPMLRSTCLGSRHTQAYHISSRIRRRRPRSTRRSGTSPSARPRSAGPPSAAYCIVLRRAGPRRWANSYLRWTASSRYANSPPFFFLSCALVRLRLFKKKNASRV